LSPHTRLPLDAPAIGLMLVLCLIWSLQQIVLKATSADFSPLLQIALRSGLSAALVWGFMRWRNETLTVADGVWQPGVWAGLLFALEFMLIGLAVRYTSASHIGIFLYTAPLFAALGLHWRLPSERLAPVQWLGVGLAFMGTAWAFLSRTSTAGTAPSELSTMLWGDFLALLAGMGWGATTVVVRSTKLSTLPATQTLLYQLLMAFVVILPGAYLLGHTHFTPTPIIWATLAFQAILVSFISYLAWFWMLRKYQAAPLGVFAFMTPIFGVILGVWLLNEPLESGFIVGALLVLGGVILVSGYNAWKARQG
jgi:drug/metabolite transporter (DMT)-like permease